MALPATIYRASVQLADVDGNRYEQLQATLARHPSETPERLVSRLLAYALFYEEGLAFTRGVSAGDEPDLWLKEPDGRVALWIEVGLPEAERLVRASRHAGRVILLAFGNGRRRWEEAHLPRLAQASNLLVCGLEQSFLQKTVAGLERSIDWSLTVSGGMLYLETGGSTVEGALEILKEGSRK